MGKEIAIDFETYSEEDLRKVGAFRYAEDPTTEVICLAYSVDEGEIELWLPGDDVPECFSDASAQIWAWNATFEAAIWPILVRDHGFPAIHPGQWRDTMALSAYFGFPLDLDRASQAVGDQKKDKRGTWLIHQLCKPCKPSKQFPHTRRTPTTHPELFDEFYDYCIQDVRAESSVRASLPRQHLPESEQRLWYENLLASLRGILVDLEFVGQLAKLRDDKKHELSTEILGLTGGIKATQVARLREHIEEEYEYALPDLTKATVTQALSEGLPARASRILQIRQALGKTAVNKLDAMRRCASPSDHKLRGMLVYYGAGTGRFAGRLVQLHNLARGYFPVQASDISLLPHLGSPEDCELIYGDVFNYVSTMIRPCLVPEKGKVFYDADYAAIEARGTAWLANQVDMLKAFEDGLDVYKVMAARIFNVEYDSITWFQRWVGKTAILGLGYQMGVERFLATCESYGQDVGRELAEHTVNTYRETNWRVRDLWYESFRVFKQAIVHPNSVFSLAGRVQVAFNGRYLYARLPSGRTLTYVTPRLVEVEKSWGPTEQIQYKGIDSKTRQWTWIDLYGGKIVENLVQAIARDVMCENIINLIDEGFEFLLSIHDQILCQHERSDQLDRYLETMSQTPSWAHGFPIKAEGELKMRFSK